MACSKCCVFTIALIFPAELVAQYGVRTSTLLSQASILERNIEQQCQSQLSRLHFLFLTSCFQPGGTTPWWNLSSQASCYLLLDDAANCPKFWRWPIYLRIYVYNVYYIYTDIFLLMGLRPLSCPTKRKTAYDTENRLFRIDLCCFSKQLLHKI